MSLRLDSLPFRHRLRLAKNIGNFNIARLCGNEAIFVYQMGKVGSSELSRLITRVPGYSAVQVHRLIPERTAQIRNRFDAGEHHFRDMRFEQWLYRYIASPVTSIRIVTSVREPMAHSYSAFFQNIARSTRGEVLDTNAESVEDLRERFLAWEDLGAALTWLDVEASSLVGCDLTAQPFDIAQGWSVLQHGRFSVLLIKAELNDNRKRAAIHSFLGCDPGAVSRTNSSKHKNYADAYRSFISQVKLPTEMAQSWADHRYTRRFYSEDEIGAALAYYSDIGKSRK